MECKAETHYHKVHHELYSFPLFFDISVFLPHSVSVISPALLPNFFSKILLHSSISACFSTFVHSSGIDQRNYALHAQLIDAAMMLWGRWRQRLRKQTVLLAVVGVSLAYEYLQPMNIMHHNFNNEEDVKKHMHEWL